MDEMDRTKNNDEAVDSNGPLWRCKSTPYRFPDYVLLGILMLVPSFLFTMDSNNTAGICAPTLFLAGVAWARGSKPGGRPWGAAMMLDWGFLAYLSGLPREIRLTGVSLSVQTLFLILLILPLVATLPKARPSMLPASISSFVIGFFVLCLAPASCLSGALTLQTLRVPIYALIFILLLEPLCRLLESSRVRRTLIGYGLILTAVAAARWMMSPS